MSEKLEFDYLKNEKSFRSEVKNIFPCFTSALLYTSKKTKKIIAFDLMSAFKLKNLKKLFGPFLWMGFNCLKTTEPMRGDSLLFNTLSPGVLGTYLIDFGRMKG